MSDPAILSAPWTPDPTNDTDFMRGVAQMGFQADMDDFAGMAMRHAFERTTAGIIAEDTRIREAEEAAGTANEDWWVGGLVGMPSVNPKAMTPEEFKAQGFDRKGKIQWTSDMTLQRAQILAETYDRRQIEAELLQRDGQGAFRTAVGFGAALLANMPDPVNLIPFGGAVARGASLGRRAFLAAREGAVSTLAADAILMPEAVRRGDDVDFGDLALDVTFGALLGGGLGAAGGLLHNRRVAALEGERAALQSVLTDAGMDSYAAGRSAEQVISVMADMPYSREASRLVRGSLAGLDRMSAGRLLDRAMIAMRDGEDLDVGRWVEELQLGPAMQRARNNQIRALLDSGNYSSVTFGTMSPERTTELNALLTERGAPLDGDELVVSADVGRALFDSGLLRADADADDVARLLSEALTIDRARAMDIPKDRRTRSLFELRQALEDAGLGDGKPFDLSDMEIVEERSRHEKAAYRRVQTMLNRRARRATRRAREAGDAAAPMPTPRATPAGMRLNATIRRVDFTRPRPEPVITPPSLEEARRRVALEEKKLATAYDSVLTSPLGGPPDEVLATLRPEDIEAVLVHRGPALERDGHIVVHGRALQRATGSKNGFGMVKIIFGHGEGGNKTPDMPPVTREEVIALPRLVRDFEGLVEGDHRVWRIPREDGNVLRIVTRHGEEGPGERLVSMYVGKRKGGEVQSRKRPPIASSAPASDRSRDTDRGITISHPAGEQGASHMTFFSMPEGMSNVNAGMKALAPEEVEALRLKEEGRAKPEDIEVARRAEEDAARIDTNENAALAVTECIIGSAD